MKKLLSTILALSIASANAADMASGYYVKAELGKSWPNSFSGNGSPTDYLKAKPKNNLTYGLAIGYRFNDKFRADVNGQIRCLDYKASGSVPIAGAGTGTAQVQQNQQIKNYSLFFNGYYDIAMVSMFTPYVTAGFGYAYNNANALASQSNPASGSFTATGKNTSNFAWNVGAGTAVKLHANVDLDIAYRYVSLGKVRINSTSIGRGLAAIQVNPLPQSISAHQLTAGLTYKF